MRYFFLAAFIFSGFLANAQNGYYKNTISSSEETQIKNSVRQKYWKNNSDVYKKEIPEKWKEESAVILERNILREYFRNTKHYLRFVSITHEVMKLQNQGALEKYSELYFAKLSGSQSMKSVELRIVKPDGSSKEIDVLKEGIEEKVGGNRVKIALPDLEIGDIIDYYEYTEVRFYFPSNMRDQFDPDFLIFNEDHPILDYNFSLVVGPSVYFNGLVKGVEDFKYSSFTRDKDTFHKYSLKMENIEEYNPDDRWTYPYVEMPNLRYQVFIGQKGDDFDHLMNIGGESKYNKKVSEAKLMEFINKSTVLSNDSYLKSFNEYTKENKDEFNEMKSEELINKLYDFYKALMIDGIENKETANYSYEQFFNEHSQTNSFYYIARMTSILDKFDIENDVVLTFNKRYTSTDDYRMTEEIFPVIRAKTDSGKDIYLCPPTIYAVTGEIPEEYQGTVGLLYDKGNKRFDEIDIPTTAIEDNGIREQMSVSIVDFKDLAISRTYETKGSLKELSQRQLLNIHEVIEVTKKEYGFYTWGVGVKSKYRDELNSEKKENEQQVIDDIEKMYLKDINETYDVEIKEVEKFEITHAGSTNEFPNLVIEEKFILPDYVKKLGPNYMIQIGKLIGGQVAITEEEKKERKYDIYMSTPRSFNYTITLDIPAGYSVSGLENLSINVENETGSFTSSGVVKDGKLIIETNKVYNNYSEPKANWLDMIEFLNAAYNFTDQKILLKKGA